MPAHTRSINDSGNSTTHIKVTQRSGAIRGSTRPSNSNTSSTASILMAIHNGPGSQGPIQPPKKALAATPLKATNMAARATSQTSRGGPEISEAVPPARSFESARLSGPQKVMPRPTIRNNGNPSGWRMTFHSASCEATTWVNCSDSAGNATPISTNMLIRM